MRDWKKKICALACLLPAAAVFVCMFFSLRAYVKPTFQVEAIDTDEAGESEQTEKFEQTERVTSKAQTTTKPKINIQKTVKLPAVLEQETDSESNSKKISVKTSTKTENSDSDTDGYKDGTYYGTGTGFEGEIKVKVTIKKGKIIKIEIVQSQDGESYLKRASALLVKIIKRQSTNVDAVSGATYSSNGLIEAVRAALKKAEKKSEKSTGKAASDKDKTDDNKETDSGTNLPSQTAASASSQAAVSSGIENSETPIYANGEYKASVICNPNVYADFDAYTLSLKITIENDRITSVTDVKGSGDLYDSDNDLYIKRAVNGTAKYPGVAGQIVSKGTCEGVDAVSGATCSSNAIIEAVKKALESAKK